MLKSMIRIFKGNFKIEKAFSLARDSFGMYPKQLVAQMPTSLAREWRQMFRYSVETMELNDHESASMMIIAFVGLVEDSAHRARIDATMLEWYRAKLIRADVYLHFREERNKKPEYL